MILREIGSFLSLLFILILHEKSYHHSSLSQTLLNLRKKYLELLYKKRKKERKKFLHFKNHIQVIEADVLLHT